MNVQEILKDYPVNLPINVAAQIMGKTQMFLRCGLRADKFPFGTGVLIDKEYSYFINTKNFLKYLGEEVKND